MMTHCGRTVLTEIQGVPQKDDAILNSRIALRMPLLVPYRCPKKAPNQ